MCILQIFTTLFGTPQGPLIITVEVDQSLVGGDREEQEEGAFSNATLKLRYNFSLICKITMYILQVCSYWGSRKD